MYRATPVAALVLSLAACSATKPIGLDWSGVPAQLRQSTVAVSVVDDGVPLIFTTPQDIAGAGLIDTLTRPDGSNIAIPNPAYLIAVAVREELVGQGRLQLGPVPSELTPWLRSKRERYAPGQPTLEIYADFSHMGYLPFAWSTYQYWLKGSARLLSSDGEILWQNTCDVGRSEDKSLQLHRTEFGQEDGKKLRGILELAASRCARQISPPPVE